MEAEIRQNQRGISSDIWRLHRVIVRSCRCRLRATGRHSRRLIAACRYHAAVCYYEPHETIGDHRLLFAWGFDRICPVYPTVLEDDAVTKGVPVTVRALPQGPDTMSQAVAADRHDAGKDDDE
jgi:hypothetical protein